MVAFVVREESCLTDVSSHGGALFSGGFSSAGLMLRTSRGASLRVHTFVLKPCMSQPPKSFYRLALTWHKCSKYPTPTVELSRNVFL